MPFTREEFDRSGPELLHGGRWGNADMFLFRKGGEPWVVKDFRSCPAIVRHTWGARMAARELSALRRLDWIPGFPRDSFRLDRFAMAYRFVAGTDIGEADLALLTPPFFQELESLVRKMHERGVAHLDIRTGSNVLITDGGRPFLLDFQSHVRLEGLPSFFRGLLVDVDLSGVYKHWARCAPDSMGEERTHLLRRVNRWRRYWILKGYLGIRSKEGT
jgi:RIO-like serine/threonine protein kinase